MDDQFSPRFYQALNTMGEFFGDELSVTRQRLYFHLLAPKMSIEEWEQACLAAMGGESFHKVPLPAVMQEYVKEFRQHRHGQASVRLALPEPEMLSEEVKALIASVWPTQYEPVVTEEDAARKAVLREQVKQVQGS